MALDDIPTLSLVKPATPEALRTFRVAVVRALEGGAKTLLVDIDEIGTLDSPTIAALIVALRAARDRSALLSLRVSRKNLLETLRITALDQVFTIVVPMDGIAQTDAPKRVRRPRQRRTVAAIAWMAALTTLGSAHASAGASHVPVATPRAHASVPAGHRP